MPAPYLVQAYNTAKESENKIHDDATAAKFMTSCAGCHSLDGKQRTGPALNVAAGWPDPQLAAAIKKMEPKAGPLPDDVVAGLVAFLKSPDSRERLMAEESRMAAQLAPFVTVELIPYFLKRPFS